MKTLCISGHTDASRGLLGEGSAWEEYGRPKLPTKKYAADLGQATSYSTAVAKDHYLLCENRAVQRNGENMIFDFGSTASNTIPSRDNFSSVMLLSFCYKARFRCSVRDTGTSMTLALRYSPKDFACGSTLPDEAAPTPRILNLDSMTNSISR